MLLVSVPPRFHRGFFIPTSNLWSHPCPLFAYRTASPCVVSPSPTAANAALPAPPIIPTSAPTTPAKNPRPAPPINSPANCPISSPANTSPPAISAPPSVASYPPSSAATSSLAPHARSLISPKLSPKPSTSPRMNTSTPSAPTLGARPSAIPSVTTSITATLLRPPNRLRLRLLKPHQLNNRLRLRILPCLRRRPNLSSTYWPVGTCPERISRLRPDQVGRRVKNHPPPNPFRSNT